MVWTCNGDVSNGAQRAARIGIKRHAFASITRTVAAVGNRQRVSDNHSHDNHMEEVINNNEHPGFPVITGRLYQLPNRQ